MRFNLSALFAFVAASMSQHLIERAHYVLRHYPDVTAYFRDVDSGRDWPSGDAVGMFEYVVLLTGA